MRLLDAVVKSIQLAARMAEDKGGIRVSKPTDGPTTVFIFDDGYEKVRVTVTSEPVSPADQVRAVFGIGPAEMFRSALSNRAGQEDL